MRVNRREHELPVRQFGMLFLNESPSGGHDFSREADEVAGRDDDTPAVLVLQRDGARLQRLSDARCDSMQPWSEPRQLDPEPWRNIGNVKACFHAFLTGSKCLELHNRQHFEMH